MPKIDVRSIVIGLVLGSVLGAGSVGGVCWKLYTDAQRASAIELGRLTEINARLTADQQRARDIIALSISTIDKIKRLVELYWPGK